MQGAGKGPSERILPLVIGERVADLRNVKSQTEHEEDNSRRGCGSLPLDLP
jgi:hypothetical protein